MATAGCLTSGLKKEIDLVKTISMDETLAWLRDGVVDILLAQLAWETEIENSLEQAGINIRISDRCKSLSLNSYHVALGFEGFNI